MSSILILMRISNLILMRWFQVLDSREVYPDSGLDMLPIPEARFRAGKYTGFWFWAHASLC